MTLTQPGSLSPSGTATHVAIHDPAPKPTPYPRISVWNGPATR